MCMTFYSRTNKPVVMKSRSVAAGERGAAEQAAKGARQRFAEMEVLFILMGCVCHVGVWCVENDWIVELRSVHVTVCKLYLHKKICKNEVKTHLPSQPFVLPRWTPTGWTCLSAYGTLLLLPYLQKPPRVGTDPVQVEARISCSSFFKR